MASDSLPIGHSPAQEYTFRVPSPPRVVVAPPTLKLNGPTNLGEAHTGYESSGFTNVEFLRKVTYLQCSTANSMLEWKYDQRRDAQSIAPFLYLGPMTAAKDKDFLVTEGITMVLAMRNTQAAMAKLLGSRAAHDLGLEVLSIDVNDNQELIAAFPRGIEAINAHLSKMFDLKQTQMMHTGLPTSDRGVPVPGKVLVYCETGNERSAAMVVAYMMAMYSQDLCKAIQAVQSQRFCVALDDRLRELLRSYESILKAKRDVYQSQKTMHSMGPLETKPNGTSTHQLLPLSKSMKRSFDDARQDEMDFDMEGAQGQYDAERFEARGGQAPFS